jgi:single stranded DNA-binding protein
MPTATKKDANDRSAEPMGPVGKVGNLTRDPELRVSEAGTPWCRFGLAVHSPKVPGDWAGEQLTEFYEVTCFSSLAEHASRCLTKGSRVVVTGRGELDRWKDDQGKERETKRIIAEGCGPDLRFGTATVGAGDTRSSEAKEDF